MKKEYDLNRALRKAYAKDYAKLSKEKLQKEIKYIYNNLKKSAKYGYITNIEEYVLALEILIDIHPSYNQKSKEKIIAKVNEFVSEAYERWIGLGLVGIVNYRNYDHIIESTYHIIRYDYKDVDNVTEIVNKAKKGGKEIPEQLVNEIKVHVENTKRLEKIIKENYRIAEHDYKTYRNMHPPKINVPL